MRGSWVFFEKHPTKSSDLSSFKATYLFQIIYILIKLLLPCYKRNAIHVYFVIRCRGGVEDTRLEAKAKDTKKSESKAKDSLSEDRHSRGQGQKCSRPRTNDTAARVPPQKKVFKKSFSGNFQFIGVARIFEWGGLNHESHTMTPSKICLLALNQEFGKRKGLKLI